MKSCKRCNLNFPDSLKFCEACGGALVEVATLRCPACGDAVQPGWKFCAKCRSPLPSVGTGDLSQAVQTHSQQSSIPIAPPDMNATARLPEEPITRSTHPENVSSQIRVRCRSCRNLVDEDSEFCEFCGASMFEDAVTTRTPPPPPVPPQPPPQPPVPPSTASQTAYRASDDYQQTYRPSPPPTSYAPAPQPSPPPPPAHDKTPPSLSMLSSYGTEENTEPASFRWWHGLILLVFFLVVVAAVAAGGWWWWSNRKPAQAQAQPNNNDNQANSSTSASPRKPAQLANESSADNDLKRLQERVSNAKPSDSEILTSIKAAEDKYKADYRFTYERAKLFSKGLISHDEAFDALYEGAEKAIDTGKNQEMLDDMTSRKDSDFSRLSRGHRDWGVILQALGSKDKAALKGHVH